MKYFLFFVLFLAGCRGITPPPEFTVQTVQTHTFSLAAWSKLQAPGEPVKIYIEGDGRAFDIDGQPTSDPTPRGTMLREIAFGDTHPNVVYLGRPCQFVTNSACRQKYWTTARFAPEVIDAETEAVKFFAQNRPVTLVGFSGGAMVVALIAATRPEINVAKVITVSGNLDHQAWTAYHRLPPLSDSLNLPDYMASFSLIPQYHYVGSDDDNIPPALTRQIIGNPRLVREVKGAGHSSGYQNVYGEIRAQ